MTAIPCLQSDSEAVVWGYLFLHAQIRSPNSLYQPGFNPSVPKTLVGVILTTSTPPLAVKRHQFNPHSQPA
jgi:hypothetical protein